MTEERERKMALKMIKTIDQMNVPATTHNKIKGLYIYSDELAWLAEHSNRDSDDIEILFKQKRAEIFKIRDQIISGELTDFNQLLADYRDLKKGYKPSAQLEEHEPKNIEHLQGKQGISDFWKHIVLSHPHLEEFITDQDRAIVQHLKSVFVEQQFIKPSVVTVRLEFNENEFFDNKRLEYTLRFEDSRDELIEAVIGTEIMWKDKRKNVTRKRIRKTQVHRETGEVRNVFSYKKCKSFFNIFTSLEAPNCTNPKCKRHQGQFEQQKLEFGRMSKYRQEKTIYEQELTNEHLTEANNIALTLYDIYSRDALENYLGFWRAPQESQDAAQADDNWEDEDEDAECSDYESEAEIGKSKKQGKSGMTTAAQKKVKEKKKEKAKAAAADGSDDWCSESDSKGDASGSDSQDKGENPNKTPTCTATELLKKKLEGLQHSKDLTNQLQAQLSQACKEGDPMKAVIAQFNGELENMPECKQH